MDTVCVEGSPPQVETREIILPPPSFTALFPAGRHGDDYFRRLLGSRRSSVNPPGTRPRRSEAGEAPHGLFSPLEGLIPRCRSGFNAGQGH
ncbi:hypothetical protein GCM10010306_063050 [Streptomyces umbrinus]|nr:hypothetical protein GCM10010306_063050 [Streptomyces umbrinus]